MLAGFELRRRWRRVVVLTVLVGLVGAVVLSTVAGARRSNSALARFDKSSRASQLELFVGDPTPSQLRDFAAVDGVDSYALLRTGAMTVPGAPRLQAIASAVDAAFGTVVDRARVVSGRAVDPSAVDEVTIGEALAAQLGLTVGDHLDGLSYTPKQVASFLAGGYSPSIVPAGPKLQLRIVGIVRRPLDLGDRGAAGGVLVLTPAFNYKYEARIGTFGGTIMRVRTRHGAADVPQVAGAARRIFGKSPQFGVQDLAIESQGAQNAIDTLTAALWVFAGVAALAGLVAIAIVLSREISLTSIDQTTQSALGLTRLQRIAVGGLQGLPVALGGGLFALFGAALASPLFPIGVARRAEPDAGFHIDGIVLGLGTVAIVAGILLIAFTAALQTTGTMRVHRAGAARTATVIAAASRAGLPPVAATGVRMAVQPGRGPTTIPIRSAIFGAVFGVVGIVAVLIFASSLDHLVATPARYGWTWDFAASPDDPSVGGPETPVAHVPGVAAVAELNSVSVQLDGRPVIAWGFKSLHGTINPEIIAGRTPQGPDEIALGSATLSQLGKSIGATVHGEGPDGSHDFRIVGRAVFATLDSPQALANGADFTGAGLDSLLSPTDLNNGTGYLVGRVAPGAQLAAVESRVAAIPQIERPFGPSVPVEVDRLRQVNWLPATLAALLAILALLAVGHALITSVRRRRHELAILQTLGFERRQIRAIVAWQATALATMGLIIGIPAGVVVGRLVWRLIANGLGVSATPAVPVGPILLAVLGVVVLVNLLAYFPARAAARTRPAVALRSE